jgi:DNA-directed RNA polymerase subunit K/omega
MQVFTPIDAAKHATNKYLAVLVAAKYARVLNENSLGRAASRGKKLTTQALEELAGGKMQNAYRVVPRRRAE